LEQNIQIEVFKMEHGVFEQIIYLMAVIFSGGLIAFLYDILRASRKIFKQGVITVNLEDIIFCVLCGLIIFSVTFYYNSGEIRLGTFFGAGLGAFVYFWILRNNIVKILVMCADILSKFSKYVFKILMFPLIFCLRLFKRPVNIIFWYAGGRIKKIKSIIKVNTYKNLKKWKILKLFMRKQ